MSLVSTAPTARVATKIFSIPYLDSATPRDAGHQHAHRDPVVIDPAV